MLVKHIVKQGLLLKNAGVVSRAMSYHGGHHHASTMNDLPVPSGDWKEQHTRRNTTYNAVLISGILTLVGTIALAKSMNIIHLNSSPPESLE